jgi:hypothetical protein
MTDWENVRFRKSVLSSTGGCVEVAHQDGLIGVRDSKARPAGPVLEFTLHEWSCFLSGVHAGEFDPKAMG